MDMILFGGVKCGFSYFLEMITPPCFYSCATILAYHASVYSFAMAMINGYHILEMVGEGSFGLVYKCRKKFSKQVRG